MQISETFNRLDIVYTGKRADKIIQSLAAAALFLCAAFFLICDVTPDKNSRHPEFLPIFMLLMAAFLLAAGLFFLAKLFETNSYFFDKTVDKFYLHGRKSFFRRWAVEGAVSDITGVSYKTFGRDVNTWSEIFLTYRFCGSETETIKCGTGVKSEDGIITEYIKKFIEPEETKSLTQNGFTGQIG